MRSGFALAGCLPVLLLCGLLAAGETEHDWNDDGIRWAGFEQGLAQARESGRPICLIFYTTWCPHCVNYARLFHEPDVAEKSNSFVMIRLDRDRHRELSKKFSPDGEYIPRTYFLNSSGELDPTLTEKRERFRYFYDENDPAAILAGMERALARLR